MRQPPSTRCTGEPKGTVHATSGYAAPRSLDANASLTRIRSHRWWLPLKPSLRCCHQHLPSPLHLWPLPLAFPSSPQSPQTLCASQIYSKLFSIAPSSSVPAGPFLSLSRLPSGMVMVFWRGRYGPGHANFEK